MASYGSLCAQFYDLDKPQAPADAIAYYRQRALDAGGAVLEPMCGTGRFLLPLLRSGVDIEGVDAAPAMLAACRRHAERDRLHPVLYQQSLEVLALPRRYRLAFVPSGSIGLVDSSVLADALRSLKRHLEPGAALLLELVRSANHDDDETKLAPRSVQIDDETCIVYRCQASLSKDGRSIRYEGRYEKQRRAEIVETESESLVLMRHRPETLLPLLRACGYARAWVVESGAYASLESSGYLLIEACAEADHVFELSGGGNSSKGSP